MIILAVVPAQAGNTPDKAVSDPSVSTYIIVFENTSHDKEKAKQSASELAVSCGGHIKYHYKIIDGMAVTLPDEAAEKLRKQPGVKYVEKDREVHVLLDKAVPQIGADQAWASGYTGKGVKVCVIDTGVDADHPDLNGSKVVAWVDYISGRTTPYDDQGHGTHVSGTIAGTGNASGGQYKGVAPEASLMVAKALNSKGTGSISNIVAAIDWATENGAQVISMSLGSPVHDRSLDDAVTNAVESGVTVVVAAGNDGPGSGTISCPGDCENAITVGAVDRNDTIANFSSRGPTYDNRTKPDVTAMGVGLVAARASGTSKGTPVNEYYSSFSGTSMATPMTSGAVALMLQKNPYLSPAKVKYLLTTTAMPVGATIPNNDSGWGRVQADWAVDNVTYDAAYVSDTIPDSMNPGQSAEVMVTMKNVGKVVWTYDSAIALYGVKDAGGFGPLVRGIPQNVTVMPGENHTWNFTITAPAMQGTYMLSYQVFNNDTPSGDLLSSSVDVYWPMIQLSSPSYAVSEGDGSATITVTRSANMNGAVSVTYNITDGTARAGLNYTASNGTLDFGDGEAIKAFQISIIDSGGKSSNKTINLALINPTNGSVLGNNKAATLTILEDEQPPTITYNLVKGWNMISVPFELDNSSVENFFPAHVRNNMSDMWWYDHGTWEYYSGTDGYSKKYAHLTNVEPGKGYYVLMISNASFTVSGLLNTTGVPEVGTGWTLFGVSGMNSINSTTVYPDNLDMWYLENGTWYYYSGKDGYLSKYQHLKSLDPGKGYWVNY
jgi:subtilisin family serine protease